jgi:hypothetical protein
MTVTPAGIATASRIGPTSFFPHQSAECRPRALFKNAPNRICIVKAAAPAPDEANFSIANPRCNLRLHSARYVKNVQCKQFGTVKNYLPGCMKIFKSRAALCSARETLGGALQPLSPNVVKGPHSMLAVSQRPNMDALGDDGTQPRENVAQGSPDFIVRTA